MKKLEGGLIYSARPARTRASIVIVDDRQALVGGYSFLGEPKPKRSELGILISAPTAAPCRPVMELLRWTRRAVPEFTASRSVLFRSAEFPADPREGLDSVDEALLPEEHYPDEPPDDDGPGRSGAVQAWASGWEHEAELLSAFAHSRRRPSAVVVEDGSHRDLLWHGLREAKRAIVIASDRLVPQVVGPRLVEALKERLDAGVSLRVVHRRSASSEADPGGLLRELAEGRDQEVCHVLRDQSNGRGLVVDDEVVVGSFDFLAHEGYYVTGGLRMDGELGLRVTGGTVARDVATSLGASSWAGTAGTRRRRPGSPRSAAPRAPPGLSDSSTS